MSSETDALGARMKVAETFAGERLPGDTWTVVRVDGKAFHTLVRDLGLQRPYSDRFRDWMTATSEVLLTEMQGDYAYTQSDEISVLLRPGWDQYDRRHEKAVSLAAAVATATFCSTSGARGLFDARTVTLAEGEVADYFRWRRLDAERNAVNSWAYWTLRDLDGLSARAADAALRRVGSAGKRALLLEHGVEWRNVPSWQKRGTAMWWEQYEKVGVDPRTGELRPAVRRRAAVGEADSAGGDVAAILDQCRQVEEAGASRKRRPHALSIA